MNRLDKEDYQRSLKSMDTEEHIDLALPAHRFHVGGGWLRGLV